MIQLIAAAGRLLAMMMCVSSEDDKYEESAGDYCNEDVVYPEKITRGTCTGLFINSVRY